MCAIGDFVIWVILLRESPMAEEPTGAREERKRTQTAGEISLDVTDFGEGLVWLFFLDLKERCGVSLSDGSGELSGRSHKLKYAKILAC